MRRAQAERKLAKLGYEIDWSCTGPSPGGGWDGCFDAIGRNCIDGDCRGNVILGDNAADWYRKAVAEAESYGQPEPCPHATGECDFHDCE